MDGGNKNEMEQIQRGLENFLDRELDIIGSSNNGRQEDRQRRESAQERRRSSGSAQAQRKVTAQRRRQVQESDKIQIIGQSREPDQLHTAGQEQEPDLIYGTSYVQEPDPYRVAERISKAGQSTMAQRPGRTESRPKGEQPGRRRHSRKEEQPSWEEEPQMTAKVSNSKKTQKSQKKKGRKKKSRLLRFLVTAALIVLLLGAGLYRLVGAVYGKMSYKEIASLTAQPMKENGVVNILLIGNDSRENGDDGRSDAMILLSISSRTKTIYMTSILRDVYVEIPGHDGNRLNAAYSYGGAELLMETIEKNFDIPVNRYMLVNFEAFASLVDAVDGVDLELTSAEIEYVNGYLVEYNMLTNRPQGTDNMDPSVSGLVHLNGPQALAYTRNRYLGTDFGRTERQRKVLTAVIKKLPAALLKNAGDLMDGFLPNLTTNLTQMECFRLSLMAGKLLTYDIVSDSIPQPGTYKDATIRSMAVLEIDFETNVKYLKEKIYGE